jgi:hypothetical protein
MGLVSSSTTVGVSHPIRQTARVKLFLDRFIEMFYGDSMLKKFVGKAIIEIETIDNCTKETAEQLFKNLVRNSTFGHRLKITPTVDPEFKEKLDEG